MTIVYLSHGAGPVPILGGLGHEKMIAFLKQLGSDLPKPEEILVISAHWEEARPSIITSENPGLFFDYYGFPDPAYALTYPAKGNPGLAQEILALLEKEDIKAISESNRGLDHGVFIPLLLMYPQADIPVTQLSLIKGLEPEEHLKLGKALRALSERNILIIGSGFSFHNMRKMGNFESEDQDPSNDAFQDWLIETCCNTPIESVREARLREWSSAPHARYAHPREEHLLPLHVCQGISKHAGKVIFDNYIAGKRAVALKW